MEFPIGDDYSEGGDIFDGLDFRCVSKHIRRTAEFPIGNACFSMTPFNLLVPILLTVTQNDTLDIGGVSGWYALACGCTMIIDPFELTPLTTLVTAELALQSGIQPLTALVNYCSFLLT